MGSVTLAIICLWFAHFQLNHVLIVAHVKQRTTHTQCGYPGILRKQCAEDCNCHFVAREEGDDYGPHQCVYSKPPSAAYRKCCKIRPQERQPCQHVAEHDRHKLDQHPYLCRQLGCCFDSTETHHGHEGVPRCYQTKPNCCKLLANKKRGHNHDAMSASIAHLTAQQCRSLPGTCFVRSKQPHCFYKYDQCRCAAVNEYDVKPCRKGEHQRVLNHHPVECVLAGCCYNHKFKCYKKVKLTRNDDDDDDDEADDEEDDVEQGGMNTNTTEPYQGLGYVDNSTLLE